MTKRFLFGQAGVERQEHRQPFGLSPTETWTTSLFMQKLISAVINLFG